jgi:hypothetical protein
MNDAAKLKIFFRDRKTSAVDSAQSTEQSMTSDIDKLLPSAKEVMGKIALAEAEEAEKQA